MKLRPKAAGFTIVELLVSVAVIVILAAMLISVMKVARAGANRTKCVQNLRSWASVMSAYAADNNQGIAWNKWAPISHDPTKRSVYCDYWNDMSAEQGFAYQLEARMCPAHDWDGNGNPPPTYAITRALDNGTVLPADKLLPLGRVSRPGQFLLMIDSVSNTGVNLTTDADFERYVKPVCGDGKSKGPNWRHRGVVNALFADFHIESVNWARIESGRRVWTSL